MLNFQWTREPKNYKITEQQITITTEPHTDLWQRTYYPFGQNNGPGRIRGLAKNNHDPS